MKFKAPLVVISATLLFSSSSVFAMKDYCTPKLNVYLETVQNTLDSKYVAQRQKDVAQKIMDKVKASRNETKDCVLLDKLLP